MSIEKDLLIRAKVLIECLDTSILQDQADIILSEIKELLAKPEQEQEPVAWMYDLDRMIHPISNTKSYTFGELTSIDPTHRQQDAVNIRPLYLAPPKREPLSDKEITKNTPKLIHIGERLAFHAGVRFAERHHIIGGWE